MERNKYMMEEEKNTNGLYFHQYDGLHSFGIESIDSPSIYDKLLNYFYENSQKYNWFLQGNSPKKWLYIEFFMFSLDEEDKAIEFAQKIANDINEILKVE